MSPALAGGERLRQTERFISYLRAGVVSFNVTMYLWLAPDSPRRGFALVIIVLALLYAAVTLIHQPSPERSLYSALATTFVDNVLIGIWLYATDGIDSPFFPLYYAEAAAQIGRFGPLIGNLLGVGSGLIYLGVVAFDGFEGTWYRVLTRIAYIFFVGSFVSYVVKVSRRSERELAEAEIQAKTYMELDRLRGTFVNNISHELRTPLTAIRGAASTLARHPEALSQKESLTLVEMMDRQSQRLSALVQDIIDIGLVEHGELRPDPAMTNLNRTVWEVVEETRSRLGRTIDFRPPSTDLVVSCDGPKIANALSKLLDNAIKFSDGDSPVVVELEEDDAIVRVQVIDRGIGIEASDLDSIFERFHQVDGSHTRRAGGAGIGLSIARTILELHGGGIDATSRPGEGSTFVLWFPKRFQTSYGTARDFRSAGNARTATEPNPG